jgi:diguanylate cyclase (GGDEF)-like protein
MRFGFLFFSLLLWSVHSVSATSRIDSTLQTDFKIQLETAHKALVSGDIATAESQLLLLLEVANEENNAIKIAAAQHELGHIYLQRNNFDSALRQFRNCLNIYITAEHLAPLANIYADIGTTYRHMSKYKEALDYHYRAMALYQDDNDVEGVSKQQLEIGKVLHHLGRYEPALAALHEALSTNSVNNKIMNSRTYAEIADIYAQLGEYPKALDYFNEALQFISPSEHSIQHAKIKHSLAKLYLLMGDLAMASEQIQPVIDIYLTLGATRDYNAALTTQGRIIVAQGNVKEGLSLLQQALDSAQKNGFNGLLTQIHLALAHSYEISGDYNIALQHAQQGIEQAKGREEAALAAEFYAVKVAIYTKLEDYKSALEALGQKNRLDNRNLDELRSLAITRLQAEIEFERQTQALALLSKNRAIELAKAERKTLLNNMFFGSLVAFLLFAFLLWSRFSQRQHNRYLKLEVKKRTQQLEQKNQELEHAYKTLEHVSLRDPLTGTYNRQYLENQLPGELQRAQYSRNNSCSTTEEPGTDLICFLLDIDDFKKINDNYGHLAGDKVLVQFTQVLRDVFRPSDMLIRWGGEEFLVVCRNINRQESTILAERTRQAIAEHSFIIANEQHISITCSIGFCAIPVLLQGPKDIEWPQTFSMIDFCLYAAKLSGKNCWVGILQDLSHIPENRHATPLEEHFKLPPLQVVTSLNNAAAVQWPSS